MELSPGKLLGFVVPENSFGILLLRGYLILLLGTARTLAQSAPMGKTKLRANAGHPLGASIPTPERGGRS